MKTMVLAALSAALALLAVACSDSNKETPPTAAPTPTAAATTGAQATPARTATSTSGANSPATTAATPAATPTRSAQTKINANTATRAELQAAFQAAGISNAAQWAREVEEYRPYPTNDPNFAKLRGELAKYNPGPGVVDAIVALLVP